MIVMLVASAIQMLIATCLIDNFSTLQMNNLKSELRILGLLNYKILNFLSRDRTIKILRFRLDQNTKLKKIFLCVLVLITDLFS